MTPPKPIGMNEMPIRMGAAGLGASAKGGLQSLEAIGSTYGAIQDANRQAGLDAYKAQMSALGKQKKGGTADTSPYTGAVLDSIDVIEGYLEGQGRKRTLQQSVQRRHWTVRCDVLQCTWYASVQRGGTGRHNRGSNRLRPSASDARRITYRWRTWPSIRNGTAAAQVVARQLAQDRLRLQLSSNEP